MDYFEEVHETLNPDVNWDFTTDEYKLEVKRVAYVKTRFVYKQDLLFKAGSVVLSGKRIFKKYFNTGELVYMYHHGLIPKGYRVVPLDGCKYRPNITNLGLMVNERYVKPEAKRTCKISDYKPPEYFAYQHKLSRHKRELKERLQKLLTPAPKVTYQMPSTFKCIPIGFTEDNKPEGYGKYGWYRNKSKILRPAISNDEIIASFNCET